MPISPKPFVFSGIMFFQLDGSPMHEGHPKHMDGDGQHHRPKVAVLAGVGKEYNDEEPGGDLADTGQQKNQPADEVCPKIKSPILHDSLGDVEGPSKAKARGDDRPELKLADFRDLQVDEAFVVDAHQLWEQKVELEDWLKSCLTANLADLGPGRDSSSFQKVSFGFHFLYFSCVDQLKTFIVCFTSAETPKT